MLTFLSHSSFPFHRKTSVRASVGHSEAVHKSLYEVLRVKRNASQTEIKTAYRTLAKLYHPDATTRFMKLSISKEDEDHEFIEINNAYSTLSDPESRAVYDANFNHNINSNEKIVSGFPRSNGGRFYSTRRWETDQCW